MFLSADKNKICQFLFTKNSKHTEKEERKTQKDISIPFMKTDEHSNNMPQKESSSTLKNILYQGFHSN